MDDKWCCALPQTDKHMKHSGQKYLCSNPNCRRVFSRPKVIKYYVCPTCQTLVDVTETEDQIHIKVTSTAEELVTRRNSKIGEPEKTKELEAIDMQAVMAQQTLEELCPPMKEKTKVSEKTVMLGKVRVPEPKKEEPCSDQGQTSETKTVSPTSSSCQYGYGYLSQREKGEGIPETCIECAKILNCMLSKYYTSGESVKEIKKWYRL